MGAPAGHSGAGENGGVQVRGDAQQPVHEAGVQIHIGADGLVDAPDLLENLGGQPLHGFDKVQLVHHAPLLRQMPGELLENLRPGVREGVDRVAHAVDEAGAVPQLPAEDADQLVLHLAVVLPVSNGVSQVLHHLHHLDVGPAVAEALQGAHGGGDGGVEVRPGGGEHPAGEGGVVAAAVLGVEDHAQVQELGLVVVKFGVLPQGVEEVLGHAHVRPGPVEVEAVLVEVVALGRVGVGHNGGRPGHHAEGFEQLVLQAPVLRLAVVGVEGQDAAGQLVHDVLVGGAEDHILGEVAGQLAPPGHEDLEVLQLGGRGQLAEEEEVHRLLEAEPVLPDAALNQVLDADAPVKETALPGDFFPVHQVIAVHVADAGDSGDDAGAVGIPEAPHHVGVEPAGGKNVVVPDEVLGAADEGQGGFNQLLVAEHPVEVAFGFVRHSRKPPLKNIGGPPRTGAAGGFSLL